MKYVYFKKVCVKYAEVQLIEENPSNKLTKTYQSNLINKIKDNFDTEDQKLFIASFYCYLNYKNDEFVVDLDDIWEWLGFSRKDPSKRLLEKLFKVDTDYKVVKAATALFEILRKNLKHI